MSESPDDIIQAQQAPLSHLSEDKTARRFSEYVDWRTAAVTALVLVVLISALLWQPEITPTAKPKGAVATPAVEGSPPANSQVDQLAPFAQAQQQRAREQAQDALARFVEMQILLEDTMQVQSWGSAELEAAMLLAQTGDTEFLAEHFDLSLQAYEDAVVQLTNVIVQGESLFDQHLASGLRHIAALDASAATAAIQEALVIKPASGSALAAMQRAQQLPEIVSKLRTAKNHELGGRYQQALEVYAEIQGLDPQTSGLTELMAAAADGQAGDNLTSYISRGFTALHNKQFDQAKQSFNRALALSPDNDIAKGGLQQVAKEHDLAIIRNYQAQADEAMKAEDWQAAIDAYLDVLKLDSKIQFALNGQQAAQAHLRAQRLLEKISAEPQKLSSEKLYLDAVTIVEESTQLEYAGPQLKALVTQVSQLLITYRDPVDVILLSDNATNIVMSNVGQLGYFERKTLTLRPGKYTIRGSQNGCRDIFLSVEVLPGMNPLDLSCPESIKLH